MAKHEFVNVHSPEFHYTCAHKTCDATLNRRSAVVELGSSST